jgi:serine/threonine-protein kinase
MSQRIDRIGKFEIIECLGEGSLGEVFLARDTIIGREVAVKIVRRASLPGPDPQGRFLRETQAAGRLSHANVVTIHEFGEKAGELYQVMDYVAGDDLGTVLQAGAIPPKEALDLLAQVCDGLAYAHQHGLPHRNLKPSNIRMGRSAGRPAPKLMDFAMTRSAADEPAAAAAHLATLSYAAPEALQAGRADGRADLFSVGVMLYQALTGRQPFAADTPAAVAQRVLQEDPAPLDPAQFPDLSPAIADIVRKALAKDPAKRYQTAEAMAEALRAARNPAWTPDLEPPLAMGPVRPFLLPGRQERTAEPRSGSGRAWIYALAALVVLGGAGGLGLRARRRAARRAALAPQAAVVASPLQQPPPPPPAPEVPAPAPAAPPVPVAPAPAPAPVAAPVPAPAPAARPAAVPAGAPAASRSYASLDQAASALDKDPQGALGFLEQTVASDPANERATALRIVALYRLARYGACSKAIHEARDAGHPLWPMALNQPPLRKMLEQDTKDPNPHLTRRKPAPQPAGD